MVEWYAHFFPFCLFFFAFADAFAAVRMGLCATTLKFRKNLGNISLHFEGGALVRVHGRGHDMVVVIAG